MPSLVLVQVTHTTPPGPSLWGAHLEGGAGSFWLDGVHTARGAGCLHPDVRAVPPCGREGREGSGLGRGHALSVPGTRTVLLRTPCDSLPDDSQPCSGRWAASPLTLGHTHPRPLWNSASPQPLGRPSILPAAPDTPSPAALARSVLASPPSSSWPGSRPSATPSPARIRRESSGAGSLPALPSGCSGQGPRWVLLGRETCPVGICG